MFSADRPIEEVTFTVIDVETTGLSSTDRVIEVAALRMRGLEEIERYQSLVNPGMPIPEISSNLSSITDEMVADAPLFPEVAPEFERLLENAVFVAHNAPFDLGFLSRERRRWDLPQWTGPVLDSLRLARNLLDLESYGLGALREALQLAHIPSHRAMDDVLATVALLTHLIGVLDPQPRQLGVLLQAQEPHPLSWEEGKARGFDAVLIDTLEAGAQKNQLVELEYRSLKGESVHWVEPLTLEHNGPLHYLRVMLPDSGEVRTYRLDRILAAHLPGQQSRDAGRPREKDPNGETTE